MEVMEEDDNELYQKHFSQYLEHEVTNENMEETWQKVLHLHPVHGYRNRVVILRKISEIHSRTYQPAMISKIQNLIFSAARAGLRQHPREARVRQDGQEEARQAGQGAAEEAPQAQRQAAPEPRRPEDQGAPREEGCRQGLRPGRPRPPLPPGRTAARRLPRRHRAATPRPQRPGPPRLSKENFLEIPSQRALLLR